MPRHLKLALFCGALPFFIGLAIYTLWRLTRADWLMMAGLINIVAGLVMFLAGAISLSIRSTRGTVVNPDAGRRNSRFRTLAWVALIANFPTAALIVASVSDVRTRYEVTVTNDSNSRIESFVVNGPGVRIEFAPVQVGRSIRKHLRFSGEGILDFETRVGLVKTNGLIDGYVTPNLGATTTVRIKPDDSVEVAKTVY